MKSNTPIISVCIPTYRGAAHLGATIDSVLTQTLSDFELIIIDDNSPDNTAEIVASYSDTRIRFLKNTTNLGPEGNWNRCLSEARGKYFKLLPQDDTLFPDALERQIAVLDSDPHEQIALVFGSRKIIDARGKTLATRGYPGGREGVIEADTVVRSCVRYGTNLLGEPGSVLFRLNLGSRIGPFDASIPYVIDLDYWVRLLEHGDAYYLPTPISTFRVSPGSWSVSIGNRQSQEFEDLIKNLKKSELWPLKSVDIISGRIMAKVNKTLRIIFYKLTMQ